MNETTERFLDLYKQLECTAKEQYFPKSPADENIMGRLLNHPKMKRYKEDLNYCRVVRNFLTHNPKVGGEYPLTPSESMITLLERLLKIISNTETAITIAVQRKHMFVARFDDNLMDVVAQMNNYGYSSVPIVEKGLMKGIFTDRTIYMYISKEKELDINDQTTLRYFEKYLDTQLYIDDTFAFVSNEATVPQVENLFDQSYKTGKMLSGVFITKNGKPNEQILGIVTPWDLLLYQ